MAFVTEKIVSVTRIQHNDDQALSLVGQMMPGSMVKERSSVEKE